MGTTAPQVRVNCPFETIVAGELVPVKLKMARFPFMVNPASDFNFGWKYLLCFLSESSQSFGFWKAAEAAGFFAPHAHLFFFAFLRSHTLSCASREGEKNSKSFRGASSSSRTLKPELFHMSELCLWAATAATLYHRTWHTAAAGGLTCRLGTEVFFDNRIAAHRSENPKCPRLSTVTQEVVSK